MSSEYIIELIENKKYKELNNLICSVDEGDIIEFFLGSTKEQREIFLNKTTISLQFMSDLSKDIKYDIIDILGIKKIISGISNINTDDILYILEDLNKDIQNQILNKLPKRKSEIIKTHLKYPENSAGRLYHNEIVSASADDRIGDIIHSLENSQRSYKHFYNVFVLDHKKKVLGYIPISHVLCAKYSQKISDIMNTKIITISTDADAEHVSYIFKKNCLMSAPVINQKGKVLGVITINDVLEIVHDTIHEDMLNISGVSETNISANTIKSVLHRLPWLVVILLSAVVNSIFIDIFDDVLSKTIELVVLMPLNAALAGNIGAQSVTISVGGMSNKELTANNSWEYLIKESKVGIIIGILFGGIAYLTTSITYANQQLTWLFSSYIIFLCFFATTGGTAVPLLIKYLGLDPAVASNVIVTGLTDLLASAFFLGIAAYLFL